MEFGRSFNVVCQPSSVTESAGEPEAKPESSHSCKEELASAKQAIKAWKAKADGMQKRNELLETEILLLRSGEMMMNQQQPLVAEEEFEEVDEQETEEAPSEEPKDKATNDAEKLRAELERLQPLEEELSDTREQLSEVTELYEDLLRQKKEESRLRRYSVNLGSENKAKIVALEVKLEQLTSKHEAELSEKDAQIKSTEQRAERILIRMRAQKQELEVVKTEKTELLLEKKKVERRLRKTYSTKQQWREHNEDATRELEISTLKLKTNRLQVELQRLNSSPSPLGSMYGSQESLLDDPKQDVGSGRISSLSTSATKMQLDRLFDDEASNQDVFNNTDGCNGIGGEREQELEEQVTSLQLEVGSLQKKCVTEAKQATKTTAGLEERITALQHEIVSLKDEIGVLKASLQMEREATKAEATTRGEELRQAYACLEEIKGKLLAKETKLSETDRELQEARGMLRDVEKKLADTPTDIVSLQKQVEQLQRQLEEASSGLQETRASLEREMVTVSWKNQEIVQLRNRLQVSDD